MYEVFDMYGTGSASAGGAGRDWSADLKSLFDKRAAVAAERRKQAMTQSSAGAASAAPSLPLERYVGTYTDSTFGSVQVTLVSGSLHARFEKLDIGEIEHVAYGRFRSRASVSGARTAEFTFVPDGNGHVAALRAFGQVFPRSAGGEIGKPVQ
ncbi:MAG: DUF3471 domain-containing protein [Gemmatimonadota bacterium]|nr:DUF3471 domain-containing protein [Gemmatimonadota bacterium]